MFTQMDKVKVDSIEYYEGFLESNMKDEHSK